MRRATAADLAWIVATIDANRGTAWTEDERACRGFVQGEWSVPILDRLAEGTGIFVAEIDSVLVGAVVTSSGEWVKEGPALSTMAVAGGVYEPGTFFLYGPSVVDQAFRRRGILRALFDHLSRELSAGWAHGVAFVELSNDASLAAHQRLGLEPIADFDFQGRPYRVMAFDLQ